MSKLASIMTKQRQNLLKDMRFKVILPAYSDEVCGRYEMQSEKRSNNETFTRSIQRLFIMLSSWHDEAASVSSDDAKRPLSLSLADCYSPMDGSRRVDGKIKKDRRDWCLGLRHDLWHHRYESNNPDPYGQRAPAGPSRCQAQW